MKSPGIIGYWKEEGEGRQPAYMNQLQLGNFLRTQRLSMDSAVLRAPA